MKREDVRKQIHEAMDALLDVLELRCEPNALTDTTIPITIEGLAPYHLELKPIARLAQRGELQWRQLGRIRCTTLRWLTEALYRLPEPKHVRPDDDLAMAANAAAARRVRKAARAASRR